jgi:hypothetical protein
MSNSAEASGASQRQSRERSAAYDYPPQASTYEQGRPRVGVGIGRGLAGFLLILNGLYGFLVGLAAIIHGGFFVVHTNYAYRWSIHGWGWLQLIIGCVLFAAGVCVLLGMVWARVLGAILAGFSAISSFLFLPYYPLWSIVVIAVDIFIVWALVSSTRRQPA